MRRLIVNADDFGLTRGVNLAVAELHALGSLSSATMMARAAATDEAIRIALDTPALGVGCHVVLVDGEPVLPPSEIPTLIDRATGRFHPTLGAFLGRALMGSVRSAEIEAEAAAQIDVLQSRGLLLTHIDTHKHTHMFPAVLRPVLRAARAAGIFSVRNPFEPAWSRRATPRSPLIRRMEVSVLHRLETRFRRIVAEAGLVTTDGAIGVLATGSLDEEAVRSLLRTMPLGTWELVTHPGYNDHDLGKVRTRLRESRAIEREALKAVAECSAVGLISFRELALPGAACVFDSATK